MNKKKFVKEVLDENVKAFMMHVTSLNLVYPAQKAQITLLLNEDVKILIEYLDFLDVFLEKKVLELLEVTKLNQYIIKL